MNFFTKFIYFFLFCILSSCAQGRAPIPIGDVPPAPEPTRQERAQAEEFKRELRESGLLSNERKYTERVNRITNRILSVVDSSHKWDTFVIKEDSFNAATLLGSIIIVNTGLLDMLSDDNEVAAVMGHEIAHSLASHFRRTEGEVVNEIISSLLGLAVGAAAMRYGAEEDAAELSVYLTQALMRGAIVNPHSREREREADRIGLFAMADAGFDPRAAVRVWERMARESSSGIPFFSTHPPSSERADLLRHMLPMALSRYEKRGASGAVGNRSFSSLNNVSSVNPSVSSTGLTVQNFIRKNRSDNANLKMQIDNARVLLSQSKFIDAENALRNIIKDDSTNPEAVYLLGFSLLEQKKNKEAREFLSKAVGLNFNNPAPFYDFARLKSRNGDNQNAIVYLIRACSLDNSLRKRAANDPDFQRMRNDERFRRIVDR